MFEIEAKNLVAGYGDLQILHGISLAIERGQIACLIGPNGCGKSTLLNTLFGLVKPWEGQVFHRDREITGRPAEHMLRQGIAYVLQRRSVFPQLSVYENLQMGAYIRNDEIETDIERVFEIFPVLRRKRHDLAQAMSGGEQRMLELGRVMMVRPRVLLLDEPSAGLAPKVTDEIFSVLKRLNQEEQVTLIIVEQNVRRILEFADHGYLLNQGQIELQGPCRELLNTQRLVEAFLAY